MILPGFDEQFEPFRFATRLVPILPVFFLLISIFLFHVGQICLFLFRRIVNLESVRLELFYYAGNEEFSEERELL